MEHTEKHKSQITFLHHIFTQFLCLIFKLLKNIYHKLRFHKFIFSFMVMVPLPLFSITLTLHLTIGKHNFISCLHQDAVHDQNDALRRCNSNG